MTGELSPLRSFDERVDAERLRAELLHRTEMSHAYAEQWGRDPFITVTLYVDARTPAPTLARALGLLQASGVEGVRLLGISTASGELVTVGAWERRAFCSFGFLELAESGHPLENFADFAELAAAAKAAGGEALAIGL